MIELEHCMLCPRRCGVDRMHGQTGFCKMTGELRAARAALHMWEEPCISGNYNDEELQKAFGTIPGSGTVFFSGCTLRCIYCQNDDIAAGTFGKNISIQRLADIFLELQDQGAANINLVTPTHFTPQIVRALDKVRHRLTIPVVSNTSGYELVSTLKMMDGYVDIYLTDFKYMSRELAEKYSRAKDYPEIVKCALEEMFRQTGGAEFFDEASNAAERPHERMIHGRSGMMKKGVIVRHLMLPGQLLDSKKIVRYVYETYGDDVYLSLMNQYTPLPQVKDIPELNCKVKEKFYDKLIDFALNLGVTNAFIQSGDAVGASFIPAFECEGI